MEVPKSVDAVAAEAARLHQAHARRTRQYVWTSPGHEFGHQERERNTLALLRRYGSLPLTEKTILEVGCGSGTWLQQFIRWGAHPQHVAGIDLRTEAIAIAREALPAAVRLEEGNAAELPFAPGLFDIVLQSTMFTSVLDREVRRRAAAEMLRVLKPDGLIIWYDFLINNPWNPDVSGVAKPEIVTLFSGCRLDLRRVTLVPPVLRWLAPRSWLLAFALSHIPPLCTHYIGAITKLARMT
jgi:ubiquinone/menaquinone biosynthesis C-methylase UbiE